MKTTSNLSQFHVDVASLNRRVKENPGQVVSLSEENYRYGISQIAGQLKSGAREYSVVLLAGPSASGKTTTAYKLREQMREIGMGAHAVSLDNFYKNRDFYPKSGKTVRSTMRAFMRWISIACMNAFMI